MPVSKIKVQFVSLDVLDDSDWLWGAGEWMLNAKVDGAAVGDSSKVFKAHTGSSLALPEAEWSQVIDVSAKPPGSKVNITFKVLEDDLFGTDDLGEVKAWVAYPFKKPLLEIILDSPMLSGGWFYDDYRCYRLHLKITIDSEFASTVKVGPQAIPVTRTAAGGATLSTVKGTAFTPIVEVCPVIPVPAAPAHVPVRPVLPAALAAGIVRPASTVAAPPSASTALNTLVNPSVIPILGAGTPNLAKRAARLEVTYFEPGNLDTKLLVWKVLSGPAVIVGSKKGPAIKVRGTPTAVDTMAVFEVHWDSDTGPLLATYRAWVGNLGTLPYRVTMLNGSTAALNVAALMNSATCNSIMQVVQAILYQAGILLVPDTIVTGYDGATLLPAGNSNAIYQVNLTASRNRRTRNVNNNTRSRSTRYNFRPGTINVTIVHSTLQGNANAVERNGIAGSAQKISIFNKRRVYDWSTGKGSTKPLGGSPSASWIKPSGVFKDKAGITQTLKTIVPTNRVNQAKAFDKGYVVARNTASPPFTSAMMGQLYACHVPALWFQGALASGAVNAAQYQWNCGINIAHEIGHILGLAHRGSADAGRVPPLSSDGMSCKNRNGVMKGHPWNENIMTYGYMTTAPRAHDIDLIQASVARAHPAITYSP